jgi:hypothetical protein
MSSTDTHTEDQIKAEHLFREIGFIAAGLKSHDMGAAIFHALTTDEKIDFVNDEFFSRYNDETGTELRSLVKSVLNEK